MGKINLSKNNFAINLPYIFIFVKLYYNYDSKYTKIFKPIN